eukprot:COSAG02_NODE_521_length_20750_cov_10.721079_25_plen_194_part_00
MSTPTSTLPSDRTKLTPGAPRRSARCHRDRTGRGACCNTSATRVSSCTLTVNTGSCWPVGISTMCVLKVLGADATDTGGLLLQRVDRGRELRDLVVQRLGSRNLRLASQHGASDRSGSGGSLRPANPDPPPKKQRRNRANEGELATAHNPHTQNAAKKTTPQLANPDNWGKHSRLHGSSGVPCEQGERGERTS